MKKKFGIVAIVGRVNTGKSTLLNRLVGETRAIVSSVPGTTRDKIQAKCTWQDRTFKLIDTGGLIAKAETKLEKNVKLQTEKALKLADIILFIVDVREEITPQDLLIAKDLRKSKKKVLLVVNKVDTPKYRSQVAQFYKLGLGKPWPISAIQGIGCGDLLDEILKELPEYKESVPKEKKIKIGICGKINVGKSSLFNCLLGRKEVIVSQESGTTRDVNYATLKYRGQKIELADSAGIKRKTKIKEEIEKIAIRQSLNLIKKSDLILFVLDGSEPISRQDLRIANFIIKNRKSVIITVNKWDLVKKKIKKDKYTKYLRNRLSFLFWAPIAFISAKTNENVKKILDLVVNIAKEKKKIISKKELRDFLQDLLKKQLIKISILKINQTKTAPPQFTIYLSRRKILPYPYLRVLEKQLRARFGFEGVPIKLEIKKL